MPLDVNVTSSPAGPDVNAAESLTLTCEVTGGTEEYSYQWSSNCTGNCFLTSQTTMSVSQEALQSIDSGNHTCAVMDSAGNTGSGSTIINTQGTTM